MMTGAKTGVGRSLQSKIMFFIGLTMLIAIGVSTTLYVRDFRKNYLEAIQWRSVTLAQSIHVDILSRYEMFGGLADTALILSAAYIQCKKLYDANRNMHVEFVCMIDGNGGIITHNDHSLWNKRYDDPDLLAALSTRKIKTVPVGDDYHTLIPIIASNDVYLGTIDVGFPKSMVDRKIATTVRNAILLWVALFLAVLFPVWLFIKHFVSRPISRLIQATSDIARGDLSRDIDTGTSREFVNLSLSLTRMRDAIRQNLHELDQKNQEVKALIACSPVALFCIDPQGNVTIWTDSATRLFGWDRREVMGNPLPTVPTEEKERVDALNEKVRKGHVVKGMVLLQKRKDGSVFHASLSSAPIRDSDGTITGIMGAMEDISDRIEREKAHQEVQAQLVQAQKMESVGRLAGGVAHDYNNMLGVILGYSELILDNLAPDDPMCADLREIIKATKHSADITRQLLAFARKQTISPMVQDLNHRVENTLKMLRRLIGEDIELEWLPHCDQVMVNMDMTQVDQILANLCINARDAITEMGKITIETRAVTVDGDYCGSHPTFKPGKYVCLSISDNGVGMDKDTLDNIFEPFFTTKGLGEGTGLGLATVYGIVKQNDGFINVYSEPGRGTTFHIYIPRYTGEIGKDREKGNQKDHSGHGETVLLVEDEASILKMSKHVLETLGYEVLEAQTPQAALVLAEKGKDRIQLLITDVILPEMNGRELSMKVKAICPDLNTLYMSGYTANVIAHKGVLDEDVNFIQKPFSKNDLAAKVREVLDTNTPSL